VTLAFQRVGDRHEGARSQRGIADRIGARQRGGRIAAFGQRVGPSVPDLVTLRCRDERHCLRRRPARTNILTRYAPLSAGPDTKIFRAVGSNSGECAYLASVRYAAF
jgi:hypothetical protein